MTYLLHYLLSCMCIHSLAFELRRDEDKGEREKRIMNNMKRACFQLLVLEAPRPKKVRHSTKRVRRRVRRTPVNSRFVAARLWRSSTRRRWQQLKPRAEPPTAMA
ncbi:unnamed protein product, partial [Ectocarpus fasciculatus]